MNYSELLEKINKTEYNINQSDLARALGIDRRLMSYRVKNNTTIKVSDFDKLEEYFKLNNIKALLFEEQEETYIMDYYPEVFGSCGTGVFELSQTKEQIRVPKNALFTHLSAVKKYSVINAYGNSMQPFILDSDKLIVEHWEGEQIIDNRVYVFVYDKEIFIKRLVKNINQLVIMSDNKEYDIIKLMGKDLEKVHIIGQIVGLMRNIR